MAGVGTEISVSSKVNILNGNDIGQSIKIKLDIGTAVGWDQGISGIRTEYYFLGNYKKFSASDFYGERISLSLGASMGIEVGYGLTYMNVDGGILLGISKYIGISPPGVSGNINIGESYGW